MRVSALFAMGRSCDEQWASRIMDELSSGVRMRFEAARAAGELELRPAVTRLIELAYEDDREIQEMAIWALGEIGGKRANHALDQLAALAAAQGTCAGRRHRRADLRPRWPVTIFCPSSTSATSTTSICSKAKTTTQRGRLAGSPLPTWTTKTTTSAMTRMTGFEDDEDDDYSRSSCVTLQPTQPGEQRGDKYSPARFRPRFAR